MHDLWALQWQIYKLINNKEQMITSGENLQKTMEINKTKSDVKRRIPEIKLDMKLEKLNK